MTSKKMPLNAADLHQRGDQIIDNHRRHICQCFPPSSWKKKLQAPLGLALIQQPDTTLIFHLFNTDFHQPLTASINSLNPSYEH